MTTERTPYGRLSAYLDVLPQGTMCAGDPIIVGGDSMNPLRVYRGDLASVLYELNTLRQDHKDPALGWETAAIEAQLYEQANDKLWALEDLVKKLGSEKLRDKVEELLETPPADGPTKREGVVEELRKALEELAVQRQDIEDLTNERDDLKDEVEYLRGTEAVSVEKAVEAVRLRLEAFLQDGTLMGGLAARNAALDLLRGLPGIPESRG
jgi:chromosome segregation ATPase